MWWLEPILLTLLGAALGLADTSATGASGWIRVPALIAALLLAAQGLLDLDNARRTGVPLTRKTLPTPTTVETVLVAEEADADNPGRPVHREAVQIVPVPVPSRRMRENRNVVTGVMILSVWLGLATLTFPEAPRTLLSLSLLAAFLLFANGWAMLRGRR